MQLRFEELLTGIPSTESIRPDWERMLAFHTEASRDRQRPRWLRQWHHRQAIAVSRHEMTWNWAIACQRAAQRVARPCLT